MRTPWFLNYALIALVGVIAPAMALHADDSGTAQLMRSTVRIRSERNTGHSVITGHGTAFAVDLTRYGYSGKRYLLSAAHNVLDERCRPYGTLKIEITDGSKKFWSKIRVVASDENLDICLLEASDELPDFVPLGERDLLPNNSILLAGSPRGIPIEIFSGVVMHCFDRGSVRSAVRIPFDHGDSGGPMFCPRTNRIVGVAVCGIPKDGDLDKTIGLYVPLVGVLSFLECNRGNAPVVSAPLAAEHVRPVKRAAPVLEFELTPASTPAYAAPAKAPAEPVASVTVQKAPEPKAAENKAVEPKVVVETVRRMLPEPARGVNASATRNEAAQLPADPAAKAMIVDLGSTKVYVIEPGDSLSRIAVRHKVSMKELLAYNKIDDANRILVGAKLIIPH